MTFVDMKTTVDGSEIRRSPVEVGSLSTIISILYPLFAGGLACQVVFSPDF